MEEAGSAITQDGTAGSRFGESPAGAGPVCPGPTGAAPFASGSPRLLATTSRHCQKIPKHFRAVTSTPASRLADNQVVLAKEISCCSLLGGREWSVLDVSKRGEVSEAMGGSRS